MTNKTQTTHPHYMLANGELVSKRKVDDALALLGKIAQGGAWVELSDEELFSKGDKFDAIVRFYKKHDTTLVEAKAAIEHMRGEDTS
jgi:hypothetical protein